MGLGRVSGCQSWSHPATGAAERLYAVATAGTWPVVTSSRAQELMHNTLEPIRKPIVSRVGEGSGSTPAFAGKRMYVRSGRVLYCVGPNWRTADGTQDTGTRIGAIAVRAGPVGCVLCSSRARGLTVPMCGAADRSQPTRTGDREAILLFPNGG